MRFSKSARLLFANEFQQVFQQASFKVSHRYLLILACGNPEGRARLGLVIGKKNIRLACERNRVKRQIRETFRIQQAHLPPIDVIVLARRELDHLTNRQLKDLLEKQWQTLARKVIQQPQSSG